MENLGDTSLSYNILAFEVSCAEHPRRVSVANIKSPKNSFPHDISPISLSNPYLDLHSPKFWRMSKKNCFIVLGGMMNPCAMFLNNFASHSPEFKPISMRDFV